MTYHKPVLLFESIDGLAVRPDGIYVDATFGGGGHAQEILNRLGDKGRLFAFDQDKDALENALEDKRFCLINQNFRFMARFLRFYGVKKVDGILADLGVSSHQFNEPQRGFSTRFDTGLDMRMNVESKTTAYYVVNEYSEKELADVLYHYGELKNARAMAASIVNYRCKEEIKTSFELKSALAKFTPKHKQQKILAQVFQAIRIEVNDELAALKEFLMQTPGLIKQGGRLSVISYHSLEDRLVKRFVRSGLFEGEPEKDFYGNVKVPFKPQKLITPSVGEIKENNRARSAKLRIATKL
ncbi:MAG: 16S rRNA (cytosine(1402)-N(4))-methyltransferase [Flavobacteriales bacterium]|nr:MAG: 16S rRNA (cytosine(1402)-N(4))-methyltransferase [Flavobacteriales bacterium]